MEQRTRIILITICLFLILFLVSVLIWGIVLGDFHDETQLKVIKEEQFSEDAIEELLVVTRISDIRFYKSEDHMIRIVEKARKNKKEKQSAQISNHNGILKVDGKTNSRKFCIGFCFFKESIYEIYLPASYHKKITIETTSGDITFDQLEQQLSDLNIITTSGDIDLNSQLKIENVTLKSTSGDIHTQFLTSSIINMKTVSGDIENESVDAIDIKMKTTSGGIQNAWLRGGVECSTISGDIEFDYFDITGKSTMNSTSGDIEIELEQKSSCKMRADSVSGDIHFPHSESIINEGTHSLYFKTVSGDIDVRVTQ